MQYHTGERARLTNWQRVKFAASISALFGLLGVLVGIVVFAYPHLTSTVPDPAPVTVVPAPLQTPPAPTPVSVVAA